MYRTTLLLLPWYNDLFKYQVYSCIRDGKRFIHKLVLSVSHSWTLFYFGFHSQYYLSWIFLLIFVQVLFNLISVLFFWSRRQFSKRKKWKYLNSSKFMKRFLIYVPWIPGDFTGLKRPRGVTLDTVKTFGVVNSEVPQRTEKCHLWRHLVILCVNNGCE